MIKDITDTDNLRKISLGVQKAASIITSTLGPAGKVVFIESDSISPTKDGFAVSQSIELEDKVENIGASFVHKVCKHVASQAGDGTTTAAAIFHRMVSEGIDYVMSNRSPRALSEGMQYAKDKAIDFLKHSAEKINISDKNRIREIATISTNGNKELGDLVSELVTTVGADGVVNISDSKSANTTYKVIHGMKLTQGFVSPYFCTNKEKEVCEMESVYIMVYKGNIDSIQKFAHLSSSILEKIGGAPLLILCSEKLSNETVLKAFICNNLAGATKICVSKLPGFGDNLSRIGEDIATFVGAKFIDESQGMNLAQCDLDDLGKAEKIVVDSNSTTIIGGHGTTEAINHRIKAIEQEINELGSSEQTQYNRNSLQERISNLRGVAAVVNVGGITTESQKEIKYRVEDAVQATKSAIRHGVIPGGSSCLVRASKYLESVRNEVLRSSVSNETSLKFSYLDQNNNRISCTEDFISGIEIMILALCSPLKCILINAGMENEWQNIITKIKEDENRRTGFDVLSRSFVDMYDAGILDPLSSPIEALKVASETACMIINSHASITKKPQKDNSHMNAMPGMY